MVNKTTVISVRLLVSTDERLERVKREIGWSKTKIVEDALFVYLNMLDKDLKGGSGDGLAQAKQ